MSERKKTHGTAATCQAREVASVHPSIRVGGVAVGVCGRPCLPSFTVCFEHVTKDALWLRCQMLMWVVR